jgi:hypothetical protein
VLHERRPAFEEVPQVGFAHADFGV